MYVYFVCLRFDWGLIRFSDIAGRWTPGSLVGCTSLRSDDPASHLWLTGPKTNRLTITRVHPINSHTRSPQKFKMFHSPSLALTIPPLTFESFYGICWSARTIFLISLKLWACYIEGTPCVRKCVFVTCIRPSNKRLLSPLDPFHRHCAGYRNNWRNSACWNCEILNSTAWLLNGWAYPWWYQYAKQYDKKRSIKLYREWLNTFYVNRHIFFFQLFIVSIFITSINYITFSYNTL